MFCWIPINVDVRCIKKVDPAAKFGFASCQG